MCKTCIKPIYGGADEGRWGSVISTFQYDSPLDFQRERDLIKPPSPVKVRQLEVKPKPVKKTSSASQQTEKSSTDDKNKTQQAKTNRLDAKSLAIKLDPQVEPCSLPKEEIFESSSIVSQDDDVRPSTGEVGTLTEIHHQENVAEVDLISLVEEQIPKYVLRADTLTDFAGYDNHDFVRNPVLPPDIDLDLSPELVEETLKYFIICSERVSQMTKTYHDIEAVTRLLEEKESDLELAARIGQGLLEKNKTLQTKNEQLEELLSEAQEKISQLRHELTMKDALLQMYRDDIEHTTSVSEEALPVPVSDTDHLQKKVKQLEEENERLKTQTEELVQATDSLEEQEVHLVDDCVTQLNQANKHVLQLQEELNTKGEVCHRQQEENTSLLSKLISLEGKHDKQVHENEELRHQVENLQTTQTELTHELGELEERYEECVSLLYERQAELKSLRKKAAPSVIHQHYGTSPFFMPEGSLAFELERSQTEENAPEDYKAKNRRNHMSRVLETAKTVRRTINRASSSASLASSVSMWSEEDSLRSSFYNTDVESDAASDVYCNSQVNGLGKPGVPGSNDLETALRRLAREDENNEYNNNMQTAMERTDSNNTPTPCPTPDSFMSTGSTSNTQGLYRIPEKLQIVKPLEGSLTLHQWQKLATPRLEGLLETRPGVQIRGDRSLELEEEVYSITDIEEDDDLAYLMAKSAEDTSATFTYTTSKIMHPAEHYTPNSEAATVTQAATRPTSLPIQQSTPALHGTTTFSMNRGLAQALHERDVQADAGKPSNTGKGLVSLLSSWLSAPRRFNSLVTETPAASSESLTSSVYTQASMYVPPLPGIDSGTTRPMPHRPDQAYLPLVSKIPELGPANVMGIAEKTGISPLKQDPVDVGLNTMMFIRRNRITGGTVPGKAGNAQTFLSKSGNNSNSSSNTKGASKTLTQQIEGLASGSEQGVISRSVLAKTLRNMSLKPGGVLSRTALMQSLGKTSESAKTTQQPQNKSSASPKTPKSTNPFQRPTSSTPKQTVDSPRPSSSTPKQGSNTPRNISLKEDADTPRAASSTPKQAMNNTGESAGGTPRPSSSTPKQGHQDQGETSLISPLSTSLKQFSGSISLDSLRSSPDSHASSELSGIIHRNGSGICGSESSGSSGVLSRGLDSGPVFGSSVPGLGFAVSPPSIVSPATARAEVYTAKISSGNVGTGTIHRPHTQQQQRASKVSTAGTRNSAASAIKILGQAVRARESCDVIGGLTSTPLSAKSQHL